MRLIFFGTPDCAVPYLQRLATEHEVLAVVTQPDRPQGRGRHLAPPPVKRLAQRLGVPALQPERVRRAGLSEHSALREAQALVVFAYGQVLPPELCDRPERPCLNVHYSLLPLLRGAAPVQRALLGGSQTTGVSVQYVGERLDSGDLILQEEVVVEPQDDAGSLFAKIEPIGLALLSQALRQLAHGAALRRAQDDAQATYAPPLRPQEGAVAWTRSALEIAHQIRACSPRPGAYCCHRDSSLKLFAPAPLAPSLPPAAPGEVVGVGPEGLTVGTGQGLLLVREVQPAGKRRMNAADFARGARLEAGARLDPG